MYRQTCIDRHVQIDMYRQTCIDRHVQIDMYRQTCIDRYAYIHIINRHICIDRYCNILKIMSWQVSKCKTISIRLSRVQQATSISNPKVSFLEGVDRVDLIMISIFQVLRKIYFDNQTFEQTTSIAIIQKWSSEHQYLYLNFGVEKVDFDILHLSVEKAMSILDFQK